MRNKRPDGKETHDTKTEVNGAESLAKEEEEEEEEEDLLSDPTAPPFHRERPRGKLSSPLSCCGNNYYLFRARGEPIAAAFKYQQFRRDE